MSCVGTPVLWDSMKCTEYGYLTENVGTLHHWLSELLLTHIRPKRARWDCVQLKTAASKTGSNVMAQVRDLRLRAEPSPEHSNKHYTDRSGLITHQLDAELGMGIRKCVTSGVSHACLSLRYIAISFYYLLLFVNYILSLDSHGVQLMYVSFSSICCSSAEALYVCQTISSRIRKRVPNQVVTKQVSLLC